MEIDQLEERTELYTMNTNIEESKELGLRVLKTAEANQLIEWAAS